jgi:hypothetical protein
VSEDRQKAREKQPSSPGAQNSHVGAILQCVN